MTNFENRKINVYMYFLLLSKNCIEEAVKKHKSHSKNKNYYNLPYTIDYHMFAFTQLLYTLKERLKKRILKTQRKLKIFLIQITVHSSGLFSHVA